jgi:xanthine/uracil permease/anti-sigma regulatory factor (Ser/Thr protein kinase)
MLDRVTTAQASGLGSAADLLHSLAVLPIFVSTVMTTAIIFRSGGVDAEGSRSAIFAGLLASALAIFLQLRSRGRIGAGHALFMGTSVLYASASVRALQAGGIDLLGLLVVVTALVLLFSVSTLASLLSRIPPFLTGMVILYVAFYFVGTVAAPLLTDETFRATGDKLSFVLTLVVAIGLWLKGPLALRPWLFALGLLAGGLVAWATGRIDVTAVENAAWFGLPEWNRPVLALPTPNAVSVLLPTFLGLAIISAIEAGNVGSAVQTQVGQPGPTVDQVSVQRAVRTQALASLAAGFLGGAPVSAPPGGLTAEPSLRVSRARFALAAACLLVVLALIPKFSAMFLALPNALALAFAALLLLLLVKRAFVMLLIERLPVAQGVIFAISLFGLLAVEFDLMVLEIGLLSLFLETHDRFPIGIVVLLGLMLLVRFNRNRFEATLDLSSLDPIQEVAVRRAEKRGWSVEDCNRLELAIEEALSWLIDQSPRTKPPARLQVEVGSEREAITLKLSFKRKQPHRAVVDEDADDPMRSSALALHLLEAYADRVQHLRFERGEMLYLTLGQREQATSTGNLPGFEPVRWLAQTLSRR